jgi:hypothetical protein
VATERQIAANRANARLSTGPKTALGKLRSSRNAYQHGLSCPLRFGPDTRAKVEAIARLLVDEDASEQQRAAATEFAEAQLELLRIRAVRSEINGKVDLCHCDTQELRRLAALDRYERLAHTRRRQASCRF